MFFGKVYGSWESIQEKKYEKIFRIIGKDFFSVFESKKVLDIGSGRMYFEKFLESKKINHKIISMDIDRESKVSVLGNGNNMPFKASSFDIVISLDTMHLVQENDFIRVLKKEGFVMLSIFFNKENYIRRKNLLLQKLEGFKIIFEFEIKDQENEYVVLAKKI